MPSQVIYQCDGSTSAGESDGKCLLPIGFVTDGSTSAGESDGNAYYQ